MKALIPERFGCGSKIAFSEIRKLMASAAGFRMHGDTFDAAIVPNSQGSIASSIDKVYDLGLPPDDFSKVVLLHCARDLVAVGARPNVCEVAFEFGVELSDRERETLSVALCKTIFETGISLGKIHSSTAFTTSVTLALSGEVTSHLRVEPASSGSLILSDRIGRLREYYFHALRGIEIPQWLKPEHIPTYQDIAQAVMPMLFDWTDVSGYGLIGSLLTLSDKRSLDIRITCDEPEKISMSTEAVPDCLQSDITGVDLPSGIGAQALPYFALREVCGPMLCMTTQEDTDKVLSIFRMAGSEPIVIGQYSRRGDVD